MKEAPTPKGQYVQTERKQSLFLNLLLIALGKRKRIRVSGNSMSPLLEEGDEVYVDPNAYRHADPEAGDIVLFAHPYISNMQVIKQVQTRNDDGSLYLLGVNPTESTDSRAFGAVPRRLIKGKVISGG
jgi:nickel-type superoxide dismutase maturation protease